MKTLIATIVSLLLGVLIGHEIEHRRAVGDANKIGAQMIYLDESFDRDRTTDNIQAIQFIQSGNSTNAVQLLSRSIGQYYRLHQNLPNNDEQTRDLLMLIQGLASTNTVIADKIHRKVR